MAGGVDDPKYISGKDALKLVHKWRHEEDAFMVGTNTVLVDNPFLTNRHWTGRQPLRITIDRNKDFDSKLNILNEDAPTLIFNTVEDSKEKNIEWVKADMEFNFGSSFIKALYERNIQSVVIEGGKILLNYFIGNGLWDEARVFISKEKHFSMGLKAPEIGIDALHETEMQDDNLYYFHK
jgi:diaminohydroxyphosphoribosylaminopyrimidine deaminase/5-amino-6-(5-phosphoribosylamino)uracil reductase